MRLNLDHSVRLWTWRRSELSHKMYARFGDAAFDDTAILRLSHSAFPVFDGIRTVLVAQAQRPEQAQPVIDWSTDHEVQLRDWRLRTNWSTFQLCAFVVASTALWLAFAGPHLPDWAGGMVIILAVAEAGLGLTAYENYHQLLEQHADD